MKVEQLTCHIGAELKGVNLAEAARNDDLFGAIKAELLRHKVLFLRDQHIERADHVAFAERFGRLEDHPVAGSHPGTSRAGLHLQGREFPARSL
jgi:taurine dioxygenase